MIPKSWPTKLHPSSANLFMYLMLSTTLSLKIPLPTDEHHLNILSIPRPNAEFWRVLELEDFALPSRSYIHTRERRTMVEEGSDINGSRSWCSRWKEGMEWRRRLERRGNDSSTPWRRMITVTVSFFLPLLLFSYIVHFFFGSVIDLYYSRSRFVSIPRLQLAAPDLQERLRCNSLYSSHVFPGPR
jgi:hypothetical protein